VNVAVRLLAALALMTLVGCGGDEDVEKADSAPEADSTPLAERVLTSEDVPGSKPDPVEVRQTPENLEEFVNAFANFSNTADLDEITNVSKKAGVKGAVLDSRYIGKTHSGKEPHFIVLVVKAESEGGAKRALDFLEEDYKQPCPESCAVKNSDFQVDDIPAARGVHSSATAQDIKRIGTPDQKPFEGYWVGFTDGPYASMLDLHGPPGSVSEQEALKIANAYYDRVVGN
jgi:hypothetical protein